MNFQKVYLPGLMQNKEVRRRFSFLITVLAGVPYPIFSICFQAHSLDFKYAGRVVGTVMVSCILEPFRWWEELTWKRRIRRVEHYQNRRFLSLAFGEAGPHFSIICFARRPEQHISVHIRPFSRTFSAIRGGLNRSSGNSGRHTGPLMMLKWAWTCPRKKKSALTMCRISAFIIFSVSRRILNGFIHKELFMKDLDG